MRCLPLLLLAFAACPSSDASTRSARPTARPAADSPIATAARARRSTPSVRGAPALLPDSTAVRGLYVNRWASQNAKRIHELVALADSTEVNALVIDMKDEFGLNFHPHDSSLVRNEGRAGKVADVRALVDTLKAHHVIPIARLVVFKDSVAARANPEHVIRKPDGTPWRDKKGLTWVDPYDHMIQDYNIRVAEEMARAGFAEIQFDYIRFPEPFKSLPPQVFKDANGVPKPKALAEFFRAACPRLHALGARCTADIFGLVTTVPGALEVGQAWDELAPAADVLLPMVYPSHYPHGAFGYQHPNAEPYGVVHSALTGTHARDQKAGVARAEHVRPYLQAFSLGKPDYGAEQVAAQKKAVYDAGYRGWILWNPGSRYDSVRGALAPASAAASAVGRSPDSATASPTARP